MTNNEILVVKDEILNYFSDLLFDPIEHKYTLTNDKKFDPNSVTSVIHKYEEPFNEDYFLPYCTYKKILGLQQFGIVKKMVGGYQNVNAYFDNGGFEDYALNRKEFEKVQAEIKEEWRYKNIHACYEGTCQHDRIEAFYTGNAMYSHPQQDPHSELKLEDIEEHLPKLWNQFISFHNKTKHALVPVLSECRMYDKDYNIAGTFDQLFWSKKNGKFVIFDWKTNTALNFGNTFQKFKMPLGHMEQCEWEIYSLQLHIYRNILAKHFPDLPIDNNMYIVWFNENNADHQVIKVRDRSEEAQLILDLNGKNIAA